MEKLYLEELLQATGGKLLMAPQGEMQTNAVPPAEILSVVTDSRKITKGCVFFALSGERFDGHAYVDASLKQGAAGCVVSKEPESMLPGKFYVLVEDTRHALGDLAHFYRMKYDVKVVGITGSVGKTTCREMVASVLSRHFRVHATSGNFNNDIGLPMTIFGLSAEDEVMVLEMGMNHLGEIRRLSQIAAPDIAVITNIGTAHIGILGSRENIFRAKKEIFEGMSSGSQAILCGDDDFLPRIAVEPALLARHRVFYAGKGAICSYRVMDAHVEIGSVDANAFEAEMSTVCTIRMPDGRDTLQVRIPAAGMHLIYPASIAAGVGDLLGLTSEEIRAGIEAFSGQRMACEKYGDILLFDDTYNASPDSMKSSLQVLACLPVQKKAAILGDMLEQGDFAQQLHREVGAAAAEAGLDTLITVGELSEDMADEARLSGLMDVRSYPDRESAAQAVEEITVPGTALLFKASHSMALDKLAAISRKKAESLMR